MVNKRRYFILFICFVMILSSGITARAEEYENADTVYSSYIYDNKEPIEIPSPYVFRNTLTGADTNEGSFQELTDMFWSKDSSKLYVVDAGLSSVIVMNEKFETKYMLSEFEHDGKRDKLSGCRGVCVKDGIIYVADTDNHRIVTFRETDYSFIQSFDKPEITQLGQDYSYEPIRLEVGITGQMYIVARGINSGFVVLDKDGTFQSFVGAPEVKTNVLDEIWKMFMTKKQVAAMMKSVPTEYNSIRFDSNGFLYATTKSKDVQPIVRLNLQGKDILTYDAEDAPVGDSEYLERESSSFVDVCVDESGVYYALDEHYGHIFAYNSSGKLLFVFGKNGTQSGTLNSPVAIELVGDKILVANTVSKIINIYSRTDFGEAVLAADSTMNSGDYKTASDNWKYVLNQCSTYFLAKDSLGKIELYNKNYKKAMTYAKEVGDKNTYSEAFRASRSNIIYDNYQLLVLLVIVLCAGIILYKKVWKKSELYARWKESKLGKGLAFAKYCSFHPFDGFWVLKREKRGNLLTANVMVVLFLAIYVINIQFCGYLFMDGQPEDRTTLVSLISVIVLMVCYCVGNWCFTSLMDGMGTMKDIYISMAVSLRPYVAFGLVLVVISHVLSLEESFLYSTLMMILFIWVFALLVFGMMMTHDYLLGKGIKAVILTIIGIALIIFLGLMFINLVDDMVNFGRDVYREMLYRQL